jgi:DNA-binding transcriptional regulator YiaG
MPNLATALRDEIGRLARKEIRSELATLKKQSTQYRRDIAALKRENDEQAREIAFLRKQEKKRLADEPAKEVGADVRFSPKWLKTHREKLGISAEKYGKLIGVSGLSVYHWEQGKANPRAAQKAKLASIRGIGKREAEKRLEMMGN